MSRPSSLPLPDEFSCAEDYVESLLTFSTSSELFQTLCGGVHILDFMTSEPDLYSVVIPEKWRSWFCDHEIEEILDLLMRKDLNQFNKTASAYIDQQQTPKQSLRAQEGCIPPSSLLDYIRNVRKHSLNREFHKGSTTGASDGFGSRQLARNVSVGMKPKKVHEVQNFAQYVDHLSKNIAEQRGQKITHLVDFGSGQNYLGRALASQPYNKHIIAIESKHLNIDGARGMDVTAKLAKKEIVMRNKRQFRLDEGTRKLAVAESQPIGVPATSIATSVTGEETESGNNHVIVQYSGSGEGTIQYVNHEIQDGKLPPIVSHTLTQPGPKKSSLSTDDAPNGAVHNTRDDAPFNTLSAERFVEAGDSTNTPSVIDQTSPPSIASIERRRSDAIESSLLVISLHSCGNLLHHGIRSLLLNPLVHGVALIGCCYNLLTERLGSPSLKLPTLRTTNARLGRTSSARDSHGFPMSERLATYPHKHGQGLRLNITARMMAVQAPQNWTRLESETFFTRHFFRALLQRIFLDRGIVSKPTAVHDNVGGSPSGWSGGTQPIIIGSLRKACYVSFVAYVRGAVAKLVIDPDCGALIRDRMANMSDNDIEEYEKSYKQKKKELSIVWSLMAFSASVVESVIVVDRWLFLKEHDHLVKHFWVEAVFDYRISPRNLVVVGIKH